MSPAKPLTDHSSSTGYHQPRTLRATMNRLALVMRDLEEQLPLPADRLVRDTTSAQQKATALRVDIEEIRLRLTQISSRS